MIKFFLLCLFALVCIIPLVPELMLGKGLSQASASELIKDQYPQSLLYSKPYEVIPNVWSAIGATGPQTYENSGHNNNLSFIVTGDGVIVINGSSSYLLAKALHDEIKSITNQPVKIVINENGQSHATLGNSYWVEQGAIILAHIDAAEAVKTKGYDDLSRMQNYNKEKAEGTKVQGPTETFEDKKIIKMGSYTIEVLKFGKAHSPGDISVWLPEQKLIISGDIAFSERMLAIFDDTDINGWLESWEKLEALKPVYVIPGHGHPTNMNLVRRNTKDYLIFLQGKIRDLIENGGSLQQAYDIDQSTYAHLDTYKELARKNAGRLFEMMEFE